ncbi:hypothetical protein KSP39_PZI012959 [Platanthera zijinensis]|uniref:Uncharacterized protein n=1 Tax=Platanthera zijinensis TaxID=2320716 RepID=A0AAP0BDE5_9ASPA
MIITMASPGSGDAMFSHSGVHRQLHYRVNHVFGPPSDRYFGFLLQDLLLHFCCTHHPTAIIDAMEIPHFVEANFPLKPQIPHAIPPPPTFYDHILALLPPSSPYPFTLL